MQVILVVEDEQQIQVLVVALLEYAGYRIITASNGKEALATLETTRPDLILSDIMMPGMDGRELCKRLQAHLQHRSIPVMLMSGGYGSIALDGCKHVAFLKKPFEVTELLNTVSSILGEDAAML
ncbi:MAG TPA: response regulator [Chloroflexia bacterium]|nr:response regulator [Chloroflexia bacterium]